MPKKIFAHGFFTINGKKMSKTIGNVINPDTLVASYGVDGARYLILTQFPFGSDGDIDQEKFTEKYNSDLANGIGNLASRIAALVVKHTALEKELFKIAETAYAQNSLNNTYSRAMDAAQLFEALQIIKNHIQGANEFFAKTAPWKIDPQRDKQKIVKILSEAIARILIIRDMIKPFMPQTAARLTGLFTYDSARSAAPVALFPRL